MVDGNDAVLHASRCALGSALRRSARVVLALVVRERRSSQCGGRIVCSDPRARCLATPGRFRQQTPFVAGVVRIRRQSAGWARSTAGIVDARRARGPPPTAAVASAPHPRVDDSLIPGCWKRSIIEFAVMKSTSPVGAEESREGARSSLWTLYGRRRDARVDGFTSSSGHARIRRCRDVPAILVHRAPPRGIGGGERSWAAWLIKGRLVRPRFSRGFIAIRSRACRRTRPRRRRSPHVRRRLCEVLAVAIPNIEIRQDEAADGKRAVETLRRAPPEVMTIERVWSSSFP